VDHDDYDNFSKLGGTQLKYIRVPMYAWDPDQAQLVVLMKVLEKALRDPNSSPVFIHCAEGKDRTGYSVAIYRMVFEGTPSSDAIHEMFDFRFNTILFRNPGFLESLDIKKVKTLMQLAP
jgi:protein tyrosine/serine phosphatase